MTVQFNVRLDAALAYAVKARAYQAGMTGSEYVSRVLRAALDRPVPGDERAQHALRLDGLEESFERLDRRLSALEEIANRR